jgi:predicted nucleotide-binding protein
MRSEATESGKPATTDTSEAGVIKRQAKKKKSVRAQRPKENSVFVVHGRNEALRRSMFDFLRALGVKPLEWEKAVLMTKRSNPYIGEILDVAMQRVRAVVVLFSPDDEARLKPELLSKSDDSREKQLRGQPRPNVLFEAGLALGRHPEKTVLVEVGRLRKFSDIAGKHLVRLTNDYNPRNDLANRLESLGCKVDKQGTDWMKTGNFTL